MKRRKFVKAAALSTLATSTAFAGKHPADMEQALYEFRIYTLSRGGSVNTMDNYLSQALIPALNRNGVANIGVFREMARPEPPRLYVLIPHASPDHFAAAAGRLGEDKSYQEAAASFNGIPLKGQVFDRYDTWLLRAFSGMPQMKVPKKGERIFELRTYEGFSDDAVSRKVKMFNQGEIDIFNHTGLNAVFFGHMVAGPDMPALTYMLSFENMEERERNWKAFIDHPDWKRLSALPEYADTVSRIIRVFLEPTDYSQV